MVSDSGFRFNRRRFVGGAASTTFALANASAATAALKPTITPFQAARAQATPSAEYHPSRHTYPLTQERKKLTIMVPTNNTDWVNNDMTRWYEDLTNVEVEWVVLPDEGANTQLNLRMASGDYPDIVMGFIYSNFYLSMNAIMAFAAAGQFIPLNDNLPDNAPNLREIVFAEYPDSESEVIMPNGNVLTMPQLNDCYHCGLEPTKFWMHTGWLEKLGLSVPTTREEMIAVLTAFRDDDPNGNGEKDEVPLIGSTELTPRLYFQAGFGPNHYSPYVYRQDGQVKVSYVEDSWREAAKYMAELNSLGLYSEESFTRTQDQAVTLGNNRQVGSGYGVQSSHWYSRNETPQDLTREYRMVSPLIMPDGGRNAFRNYTVMTRNVFTVTDRCADPALAVAWADGLYAWEATMRAQFGVPDVHWKMADEGQLGIDGNPARVQAIPQEPAPAGSQNTSSWD